MNQIADSQHSRAKSASEFSWWKNTAARTQRYSPKNLLAIAKYSSKLIKHFSLCQLFFFPSELYQWNFDYVQNLPVLCMSRIRTVYLERINSSKLCKKQSSKEHVKYACYSYCIYSVGNYSFVCLHPQKIGNSLQSVIGYCICTPSVIRERCLIHTSLDHASFLFIPSFPSTRTMKCN